MVNSGSTFEEAMKWAVKEDAINDPRNLIQDNPHIPMSIINALMINNWVKKEKNKRELEKTGIKRIN